MSKDKELKAEELEAINGGLQQGQPSSGLSDQRVLGLEHRGTL